MWDSQTYVSEIGPLEAVFMCYNNFGEDGADSSGPGSNWMDGGPGGLALVGARSMQRVKAILTRHGLNYVLTLALCLIVFGAGAVLLAEAGRPGGIRDFWTGIWWAFTTMTTVGYGDVYPTTIAGRIVGIILMVVGVGVFGMFTAVLASYFVENAAEKVILQSLERIVKRLESVEEFLSANSDKRTQEASDVPSG